MKYKWSPSQQKWSDWLMRVSVQSFNSLFWWQKHEVLFQLTLMIDFFCFCLFFAFIFHLKNCLHFQINSGIISFSAIVELSTFFSFWLSVLSHTHKKNTIRIGKKLKIKNNSNCENHKHQKRMHKFNKQHSYVQIFT